MGSPGGGDREKDLSKRRKSSSSYYVKARDWEDEGGYDEDRRQHRSSKSKKSSKSYREREKTRENDEREHHGKSSRDEYHEKGEKPLREDRHDEKHGWEFVEPPRVGSSKRRNSSEKAGKKIEAAVAVREDEEADYEATDVVEGPIWRAHELEEEKIRKAEPRAAEKDRSRKGELRADRVHEGSEEIYRRNTASLDEDSARKRSSHRERHYEERTWKKEIRDVDVDVRKIEANVEAQNGLSETYPRLDSKVKAQISLRARKGVDRAHDNNDDEADFRHERAGKSRKKAEEKKSVGEKDSRITETQSEVETRPRSSSRNEKSRDRDRDRDWVEELVDLKQKWMRNKSREESKDRVSRVERMVEVKAAVRDLPVVESFQKERSSSGWDKPQPVVVEEKTYSEPEVDALSNRVVEDEGLREPDTVDAIESEGAEYEKLEPVVDYEPSQELVVAEDQGDEKPERHRRAKEKLEREESDMWEKSTDHNRDDADDGSKLEVEMGECVEEVRKSGRRRGRDTLERDNYDRFLDRDREIEREKEREKERQREREKGRDRGRDRERRDEHYWDDHERKVSERYHDERYDIGGRSRREDYGREKYRSGREEVGDRHGRLSSRDRRDEDRTGKLGSKEEDGRLWRVRLEEEKGKKPASRDFIDETRGKAEGIDVSDDGDRLKGKYGSPDDRREPYKNVKAVISPDDRRGSHRSGKALESPDYRRGRYRSSKVVTTSRSPDDLRGHRSSKAVAASRSPDDRRRGWDGLELDYSDDRDEYDTEKSSKRRSTQKRDRESSERERERERYKYRSRERPHHRSWERGKEKDRMDAIDRSMSHDRRWKGSRDAERGSRDQAEQEYWKLTKRHENADRDKMERKMLEQESSDRSRMDRERVEELRSPQGFASMTESSGRDHQMPSNFMESGRGFGAHGGPYMLPGGDPGFFRSDYFGGMSEVDWDGPLNDERMRHREGIYLGGGDRFMDNEGPLGHDPGFGPSRGGAGDGGMAYNHHPGGRGRGSKASPNNRGRGGMMGHDGRPRLSNNQTGPMLRGMQQQQQQQQQQGSIGRGTRGGPKGARGPGREVQRSSVNPLMGPGPGIGPHFGPMGPQGMMMGPGPGPAPGPSMGQFTLLPFGGPMGWGGGGEMGMMGCPPGPGPVMGPGPGGLGPRFGPGMVPGPGPNMFFNPPGPGRGVPGIMPAGPFGGGAPPFNGPNGGGRGQTGERGPPGGGRGLIGRANGPLGRGPSRGDQNDYSQHFVDTGLRPQNFIRDVELADRFEEYPKLKELITRKDQLIAKRATAPMYMQCDIRTTELGPDVFGTKFDVLLVDPPWEEYVRRAPGIGDSMEWWPHEEIENLRIEAIADTPAFIFLWVGDAEGLEQGRRCLKKWGFRRCEDICWVKTNRENPTPALRHDSNTLFQHSKEHCLMGIKGTVRRSTDGHIIHANVDTDIIISEEPEYGSTKKPEELYHIIEHFAQGMRRIELFGEDHNIRAGWVTVGKGLTSSNFNPQTYAMSFADTEGKVWQGGRGNPAIDAPHLVGTTPEIEALRPKSPPPRPQAQPSNAGNSLSQPSAGNSISKKTSTGQVGSVQNGHPAALIPGAGHGSAPPSGTGALAIGQPPHVGGRGGGHGQIPKMRPVLPGAPMKPLGAGPGILELGHFDQEASYEGDAHEANSADDALM